MGPDEQNLHFNELRQKVCLCIHNLVLLRPKKKNVMFVVTWPKKKGSVGRLFFFFFFFFFFLLPDILISSGNI